MQTKSFDFSAIATRMTDVAALLMKGGYEKDAIVMIAITKIVSFRIRFEVKDKNADKDDVKEYNQCCDVLERFLYDEARLEVD